MNKNTDWYKKMILKFNGDEKALEEHMRTIGKKGGASTSGYGFAHGALNPVATGKLGGRPKKDIKRRVI